MAYHLPWDWDEVSYIFLFLVVISNFRLLIYQRKQRDSNYIIIKQWVSEDFQEELFAHTRRLLEGRLVTQTSSSTTELKINDKKKDKMYLVRKKGPGHRAWILT